MSGSKGDRPYLWWYLEFPPELQGLLSAKLFAVDHRLVVATLKLHVKSRKPPRCDHTMFHLEKWKDLTFGQGYNVTISNLFGVFDTLEDSV